MAPTRVFITLSPYRTTVITVPQLILVFSDEIVGTKRTGSESAGPAVLRACFRCDGNVNTVLCLIV